MWLFYKRIILQALGDTPGLVSSNWLAVVVSIVVLVSTFVIKLSRQESFREGNNWRQKLAAVRDHWKQNLRDGFIVTVLVWILLFVGSLMKTIYADHQSRVVLTENLQKQRDGATGERDQLKASLEKDEQELKLLRERKCPPLNSAEDVKRAIQNKLAQYVNAGISIRDEWNTRLGKAEEVQHQSSLAVLEWHKTVEGYLKTIPRGEIYSARFHVAVRTGGTYPLGINVSLAGNYDLLLSDLARLNEFIQDPELGKT